MQVNLSITTKHFLNKSNYKLGQSLWDLPMLNQNYFMILYCDLKQTLYWTIMLSPKENGKIIQKEKTFCGHVFNIIYTFWASSRNSVVSKLVSLWTVLQRCLYLMSRKTFICFAWIYSVDFYFFYIFFYLYTTTSLQLLLGSKQKPC